MQYYVITSREKYELSYAGTSAVEAGLDPSPV
jgi:hypothetical protein